MSKESEKKYLIEKSMNHLWNLGHASLSISPGLGGYYLSLFKNMGILSNNVPTDYIKKQYCQGCCTPFLAGLTTKVSIENKKKSRDDRRKARQKNEISDKGGVADEKKEQVEEKDITGVLQKEEVTFKRRVVYFNNELTRNLKRQKRIQKEKSKLRYPAANEIKYECQLCHAITIIQGGSTKVIEKFKETKRSEIASVKANNKQEKNVNNKNKAKNNTQNGNKKSITNKNNNKSHKKPSTNAPIKKTGKLPTAKLMNLSKMLAKNKKEEDQDKSKSFSLNDFLTNLK